MSGIRAWASAYTREGRFSPVGVAFHWSMAALILFQLGYGWLLTFMPAGGDKVGAYAVHGAVGLVIFLLAMFRLVWRLMIPDPENDADTGDWRAKLALAVEHLFYVGFLLLPISGWAMWSAMSAPADLRLGGLVGWPLLPFAELDAALQWRIVDIASTTHLVLVWMLMLLVPVHIGAALKHHFWDRNDVLRGMLPEIPDEPARRRSPRSRRALRADGPTAAD